MWLSEYYIAIKKENHAFQNFNLAESLHKVLDLYDAAD